ncbi:MAG: response regulator [Deltaproteobacteria bacterium]|nr:response regulator [Candidatus Zymogenaceae bacterium]
MNYSGNLEKNKLPDILANIKSEGLTGILAIKSEEGYGEIYFNEGMITRADSPTYRERLGRYMIENGIITEKDLRKALIYQKAEGKNERIGDILVKYGLISKEELHQNLRKIIEEIVFSMVYRGGIYRFEPTKIDERDIEIRIDIDDFLKGMKESSQELERGILSEKDSDSLENDAAKKDRYGDIKGEIVESIEKIITTISSFNPQEKVILVEDEKLMRTLFSDGLRNFGYDVESYDNPTEALEKIRLLESSPLSLVLITDIVMPGLSSSNQLYGGLELVTEINQNYPNVSIIVMTSIGDYDLNLKSLFMGASYFLRKPNKSQFDGDDLRTSLDKFVEEISLCVGNIFRNRRIYFERDQLNLIREELIKSLMDARIELGGAEKQLERDLFDLTFLKKTTKELLNKQSFSFIVDTVLRFLKIDNDRAFIGVIKKGEFRYFKGFSLFQDNIQYLNENPEEFSIELSTVKSLQDIVIMNKVFRGALPPEDAKIIHSSIKGYEPTACAMIPFRVYDKTVAVLYCDNGPEKRERKDFDQLLVLADTASLAMQITVLNEKIRTKE